MAKKQSKKKDLEEIMKRLPFREKKRLEEIEVTPEFLQNEIEQAKKAMKQDAYFGIPWFLAYSIAWFSLGRHNITISIFVIGLIYFCYAIFTKGSYGLNRKRAKIFEEMLNHLKQ
jgi:predicted nuclease of restriction endonuclease-like (RecB) superfamily